MAYLHNGKLIHDPNISLDVSQNGSFWYGDGFFEAIKFSERYGIHFLSYHWERIVEACGILKIRNPFKDIEALKAQLTLLAGTMNSSCQRIKLIVWRHTVAGYQPEDDITEYLGISFTHEDINYPLNVSGLRLAIYTDNLKSISPIGTIKTNSSQLYVLATLNTQQRKMDDSILLNTNRNIIETSRSNIYVCHNGCVYTPPVSEGCLNGIMRKVLLQICKEHHIPLQESPVSMEMLKQADEVFITSSIRGILWVAEIEDMKFEQGPLATKVSGLLNSKFNL